MKEVLIKDLRAARQVPNHLSWPKLVWYLLTTALFSPGFACVFFYRLNHFLYQRKTRRRSWFLRWWMIKLFGVWRCYQFANEISYKAEIGGGFKIGHFAGIVIGKRARIGENFTILNSVTIGEKGFGKEGMPTIGDNVSISTGAKLLGNIHIGDNVIIGALTFCDKSIPSHSIVYSDTSLVIKQRLIKVA